MYFMYTKINLNETQTIRISYVNNTLSINNFYDPETRELFLFFITKKYLILQQL